MGEVVAKIIGGNISTLYARKAKNKKVELGELLKVNLQNDEFILLQVIDLNFASQLDPKLIEFIAGASLDDKQEIEGIEDDLKHYEILALYPLLYITSSLISPPKILPALFSDVERISKEDVFFISKKGISFGKLRSGTNTLDIDIKLPPQKIIPHHILITGTTGRGKSVLMKNLLWELIGKSVGCLVIDPHNEYYGVRNYGLKDHPQAKDNIVFFSPSSYPGATSLMINISLLQPHHFSIFDFTDAQFQLMTAYYREYKKDWIKAILRGEELSTIKDGFNEATLNVARRKISLILNLIYANDDIIANGIFTLNGGEATINQICSSLFEGKVVILDTSSLSSDTELFISNMIAWDIYKARVGKIAKINPNEKPALNKQIPIALVLEEAPRLLKQNKDNIFTTIAREGRKFGIGLIAITQMPSLIPKELLANMNTKIIMGTELQSEREAVINSASQDIRYLNRAIATLNKGEAILTSTFSDIAIPLKIPFFDDIVKAHKSNLKERQNQVRKEFIGL